MSTQKLEECANASARSVTTLAPPLFEVRLDELLVEVSDAAPPRLQPATEILQDSKPDLPDEPTVSSFDQLGRECVEVRAEWTCAQDASFLLAYEVLDHVSSLADDRRPSGGQPDYAESSRAETRLAPVAWPLTSNTASPVGIIREAA
ncbi:MAG: hypothetical protein ABJE66_07640 [Deltaproteobacteria bacterium]